MRNNQQSLHTTHSAETFESRTRRWFLSRVAMAAGAAAVPSMASAQDPRVVLDAAVLNFLVRIAYVQADLYGEGVADFLRTNARRRLFDAHGGQATIDTLLAFRDQENAQAETLRSLVSRLGVPPQPPCDVTFPFFSTVPELLRAALAIENAGVSAYLGVLPLIRNPQLQSAVASLSSVQSRHAAYIGMLNGQSPAPMPADTPKSREEILGLLAPYLRPCPNQ